MRLQALKPRRLRQLLLAPIALALAQAANAAPVWITIGDQALAVLHQTLPAAKVVASAQVPVTVPVARGSQALKQDVEGVHAVEVDDSALETLSEAVHEALHKCAGFVQHSSMAEALAALRLLQRVPEPTLVPSYVIDNQVQVNALLPQLQASNILSGIEQLAAFQNRRHNSSHGVNASNWLYTQWRNLGASRRDVRVTQVTHPTWPQKSVSFEISGNTNGGETIVIGAHLDSTASGPAETVRAPGADDDASGVATLTEMIRVLMANNVRPARTLRFVAYAAEEVGLLGSQAVVANYASERRKVVGVLQLDMTAYQGDITDLWIYTDYTNTAQNQFIANLAATYLPGLTVGYDRCGYGCSDHASWHNKGYIASFPHEASNANYNRRIHTAQDTTATFGTQANHALKFAKLALAYAVELTSDSTPAAKPVATTAVARSPAR